MKRVVLIFCCFAGLAFAAPQSPQTAPPPDNSSAGVKATIEGLVRDAACPMQNSRATATEFNLKCALDCAKQGSPLIILTREGNIYLPISDSMPDKDQRRRLMPFVGKYVRASGTVFERNGTRAIAIAEIKELKDVHLVTDAK